MLKRKQKKKRGNNSSSSNGNNSSSNNGNNSSSSRVSKRVKHTNKKSKKTMFDNTDQIDSILKHFNSNSNDNNNNSNNSNSNANNILNNKGRKKNIYDYSAVKSNIVVKIANLLLNTTTNTIIKKIEHDLPADRLVFLKERGDYKETYTMIKNAILKTAHKKLEGELTPVITLEISIPQNMVNSVIYDLYMVVFNYINDKLKLYADANYLVDYYIDTPVEFFVKNTLEALLKLISNIETTFTYNDKQYYVIQYNWGKMIPLKEFELLFPGVDVSNLAYNTVLCILKNSEQQIIGYITATYKFANNLQYYVKIEMVSVSKNFQRGGTCKVLLHSLLNYVNQISAFLLNDIKPLMYTLYNAGGYISCYCYINFFTKLNYKVFNELDDPSNTKKYPITSKLCNNNRNDYITTVKNKIRTGKGLAPNNESITNNNMKEFENKKHYNKTFHYTHKSASTMYFVK